MGFGDKIRKLFGGGKQNGSGTNGQSIISPEQYYLTVAPGTD